MQDSDQITTERPETNRDRVRRLLLDPLGFRFPKSVEPDKAQRRLDRIADDIGYLADAGLKVLAECLRSKGEGGARNFWPDHATFVGFAELVQPRPIEEHPALLSWFASVEGPRALAEGTLVETFEFIARRKVPPHTAPMRRIVAEEAAENARRAQIVAERRRLDLPINPDSLAWERWYLGRRAACEALLAKARAGRGHEVAE